MFKKIINKIIMGTKCYLALRKEFLDTKQNNVYLENELRYSRVQMKVRDEMLKTSRTKARKIVRLLNANFDKKNGTVKQVKTLCNEIIKGE